MKHIIYIIIMDLVSLKRERFRVDIRKRLNEEEFRKKRVVAMEGV